MIIQFTLTVPEGKNLLARGVSKLPEVGKALQSGKILLKGGTTVSLISGILVGQRLRISGRISPRGTMSSGKEPFGPHSILIENGKVTNVDEMLEEMVKSMRGGDIAVISANAFDVEGNAAMMAGAALGGKPGGIISGLMAEGLEILIPVGLEKLIPGKIADSVRAAGRKKSYSSMGMSVGLIPIIGKVYTEIDAVKTLTGIEPVVIGRGGIQNAEGASVFAAEGPQAKIDTLMGLIHEVKNCDTYEQMGHILEECGPKSPGCKNHLGCMYRRGFKWERE